jgi:hypothetical protein
VSAFNPEHFWDTCDSGSLLIDANEPWCEAQLGSRKASLLVIAHARIVWPEIVAADANRKELFRSSHRQSIDRCEHALNVCERFLDGQATDAERGAALAELDEFDRTNHGPYLSLELSLAGFFAESAWRGEFLASYSSAGDPHPEAWDSAFANLLREVFGNPHRPVRFDPAWRTDTAVAIARQMYDSREFGAMPILADALQDAGCNSDELLNHCRSATAAHVRGCWVVDLVLGRA